mgnify:CR=1 FL=1
MIKNINEHQPHIVVNTGDDVHVIPVSLIRDVANGRHLADNRLVMALARIVLDDID